MCLPKLYPTYSAANCSNTSETPSSKHMNSDLVSLKVSYLVSQLEKVVKDLTRDDLAIKARK